LKRTCPANSDGVAQGDYSCWHESSIVATGMHAISSALGLGNWALLIDGAGDQMYIKSDCESGDASGTILILRFTAASNFQDMDLKLDQNSLTIPCVAGWGEVQYLLDYANNLVRVYKGPSGDHTIVRSWNASNGYQDTNPTAWPTSTGRSDSTLGEPWSFLMDSSNDLLAVRGPSYDGNGGCRVELKRLTKASNYGDCSYNGVTDCTTPHEIVWGNCHGSSANHWVHILDSADNLVFINEGPTTASGFTEFYVAERTAVSDGSGGHTVTYSAPGAAIQTAAPCRNGPHTTNAAGP